ncbi:MAG: hypothetical protein JWO13_2206 [Acidobacteriales bacterium]|nr:hypothetical protein [Terriglobales bacterium]
MAGFRSTLCRIEKGAAIGSALDEEINFYTATVCFTGTAVNQLYRSSARPLTMS